MASAEARFALFSEATPAAAVTKLNERICATNMQRFVTMILVVLEPAMHRATIVNAGHMAPLLRHRDGTAGAIATAPFRGGPYAYNEYGYAYAPNGFCQPGMTFRGADGRLHICQ